MPSTVSVEAPRQALPLNDQKPVPKPGPSPAVRPVVNPGPTRQDLEAAFDQSKAIFFLDIMKTPDATLVEKDIAYIPNYQSNIASSENELAKGKVLPFRQAFSSGESNKMLKYRDDPKGNVREISKFGTAPKGDTKNPFPKLPEGVSLQFYILREAQRYPTGVYVGIAQVSAKVAGEKDPYILPMPIYRVGKSVQYLYQNMAGGESKRYVQALYVATKGPAPVPGKKEDGVLSPPD